MTQPGVWHYSLMASSLILKKVWRGVDGLPFLLHDDLDIHDVMAKSSSATQWLDAAGRIPVLPKQEVLRLAFIINSETSTEAAKKKAIDKLVLHNMKLVPSVVRRCMASKRSFRFGDDFTEDLLQCGAVGLYKAANKYDPTRGYCFSTYAVSWIYQAVQREIYNNLSIIRIPENTIRDVYNSIDKTKDISFSDMKENKRARLIDAFTAMQAKSIQAIKINPLKNFEYSGFTDSDKADSSLDCAGKSSSEPMARDSFEDIIKLGSLSEMQTKILKMYYVESMSYRQISSSVGINETSVQDLARAAIKTLSEVVSC